MSDPAAGRRERLRSLLRQPWLWVVALTLLVGNWLISSHVGGAPEPARVPYTVLRAEAERGNVAEVTSQRDEIRGRFRAAVRDARSRAGPPLRDGPPRLRRGRPPPRAADRQRRQRQRAAAGDRAPAVAVAARRLRAGAAARRRARLDHGPHASRRHVGPRPLAREALRRLRPAHDVRRRGRHRGGRSGARRGRRLPPRPAALPRAGRQDPEGRAAVRAARHRQDAARPRRRRRGRRAVLLRLGLGVRRDGGRRGRQPGSRPVRAGQQGRPGDHLRRRARRDRPRAQRRRRRADTTTSASRR